MMAGRASQMDHLDDIGQLETSLPQAGPSVEIWVLVARTREGYEGVGDRRGGLDRLRETVYRTEGRTSMRLHSLLLGLYQRILGLEEPK